MSNQSEPRTGSNIQRVLHSKDETKAYYNKIAKVYDFLAERAEQPVREAGLNLLAARPGERVLEVGFGTGHCLAELAKAVGPSGVVYGIDIAENMLELAREALQREQLSERVRLASGDAAALPYDAASMDAVFMSFTLELFDTPDIPAVLAECRRVLRSGGRIVVIGMSKEAGSDVMVRVFEWTHRHFPNLLDCRPIYVRQALESSGFSIEHVAIEHMWVPVEIVLAKNP
jgi:demethylmenaquinone methyltransferase/2-methoxy-6-polyprenyl-1,4-benzoquinol methylase